MLEENQKIRRFWQNEHKNIEVYKIKKRILRRTEEDKGSKTIASNWKKKGQLRGQNKM